MNTQIYKVLSQTEAITITKQDGTQTQKSTIVLQELGNQYADSFAAVLVGNQFTLSQGDLVAAALRCTVHEYAGQYYQDVTVQEIKSLTPHN